MEKYRYSIVFMTMIILILCSCSSIEDIVSRNPQLYQLRNSECLTTYTDGENYIDGEDNAQYGYGTFQMLYREDLTTCDCKFNSLNYPCDFGKVNVDVHFSNGILTIVEYPSSDMADCKCQVDASFTIKNLPLEDFQLKVYHGDTSGKYNPDKPKYIGSGRSKASGEFLEVPYQL